MSLFLFSTPIKKSNQKFSPEDKQESSQRKRGWVFDANTRDYLLCIFRPASEKYVFIHLSSFPFNKHSYAGLQSIRTREECQWWTDVDRKPLYCYGMGLGEPQGFPKIRVNSCWYQGLKSTLDLVPIWEAWKHQIICTQIPKSSYVDAQRVIIHQKFLLNLPSSKLRMGMWREWGTSWMEFKPEVTGFTWTEQD